MQEARSKGDGGTTGARRASARASGSLLRRLGVATIIVCLSSVVLLALGFLWFVRTLPADEVVLTSDADGIVVFTGGASRTTDAIELLAAGRGKRLLISGANRATNSSEITRINPDFKRFVKQVDFDHS